MLDQGTHDSSLVTLSILIATAASYTALDLAGRMRAATGWARRVWLTAAAVAMGGGIWSMHFVAMLAFSLPGTEVTYDLALTLFSLVLPVLVTAIGFIAAERGQNRPVALAASGLVMGLGIAGMHYTGMWAMRMPADLSHTRGWVAVSILIAIGASVVALWLAGQRTGFGQRLIAACVMGLAVSGMHYAAMQGASFGAHAATDHAVGYSGIGQTQIAFWVAGTTFLILLLALAAATVDRYVAERTAEDSAALRESEQRFRLLLQGVTDYAIFMLDPKGRVTNWNSGAERIKGYRADEIVGRHFSSFYTGEDQASGLPHTALDIAAREGKFEAEGWRVRKDGTRFWASVVIDAVSDDQGRLIGFAKVTRDITERKQAQEALEKAREALAQAQKMEALGQLTGGVAHDFNNLLTAILGSLDALRGRVPADPKATRLLDTAIQAAERGAALTERMLAFARRQHLRPEPVTVPDLVRGLIDLIQRSIGTKVDVTLELDESIPPALVDANQLELALLNLVVNARDAMPNGGSIKIGARFATDQAHDEQRYVCLWVADTGEGMDAETLARAQEPFFTTKGVGKGTGLGLSMVEGLAAQSGGKLVLKSVAGKGTTAEIWLPVAPGSSMPSSAGPATRTRT